jgi:glycosyltransferase involved in cell wall biosynthesis
LNTVHKHHLLFARAAKSKSKLIVTIHEASTLSPKLKAGFRSIARFAGLKMLNRYADAFLVLSSEVKKHILQEKLTKKPVIVLPAVMKAKAVPAATDGNFIVCVPGTIDESRKDYSRIRELVTLVSSSKRKISIVLLGAAKGKSWISEKISDIKTKYPSVTIELFDVDHIPQDQFDDWLSRSHLVWLPLTESVKREHGIEKYGRTKISGGFFDAVRAGKFMTHPETIPVAEELKLQTQTYGSIQELADFILRAANDPQTYHSLESRVKENAGNFDLEKGRAALLDALNKL